MKRLLLITLLVGLAGLVMPAHPYHNYKHYESTSCDLEDWSYSFEFKDHALMMQRSITDMIHIVDNLQWQIYMDKNYSHYSIDKDFIPNISQLVGEDIDIIETYLNSLKRMCQFPAGRLPE